MKLKTMLFIVLICGFAACSTEEEGVLDTQIEVLDKAKSLEKSIQDAADEQRKQMEQQTN